MSFKSVMYNLHVFINKEDHMMNETLLYFLIRCSLNELISIRVQNLMCQS